MFESAVEYVEEDLGEVFAHLSQVRVCLEEHSDVDFALHDGLFEDVTLQACFDTVRPLLFH